MTAERHARAKEIFFAAAELDDEQRAAFVADASQDDGDLREMVMAMLAVDAHSGAVDDALGLVAEETLLLQHPERIGPYSVIRSIGAGGMGIVYEAEQETPRRRVAVKVLRLGLGSERDRLRFELEGSLLGRLQHPGIAQIFEAGASGDSPYFAMELVDGTALDEWAKQAGLGPLDRLALVARICDAVEHAHQRGVIHRDLKPGNILVDLRGQPKILDFGIARALEDDAGKTPLITRSGEIVGTLPYMSPEQATGGPGAVDTRSDVYSLGVILHELLVGRRPFDFEGLSLSSILDLIRKGEAPPLGTLRPELRGDVETIVAAAMDKDRERRYGSAAALAADIRRFLADELISVRPASGMVRLRKFVRRNQALVGAVTATTAALLFGLAATSWQAWKKTAAEKDARSQAELAHEERAAAVAARDDWKRQFGVSRAINDYVLNEMLESPDPYRDGPEVKVVDVLDRAAAGIDDAFHDQPSLAAAVRDTLAMSFQRLGMTTRGLDLAEKSWKYRRREFGEKHPEALESLAHLAEIKGTRNDSDALALTKKAHALQLEVLGPDDPGRLSTLSNLAMMVFRSDDRAKGMELMRQVVEARRRVLGARHEKTLQARHTLSVMHNVIGKGDTAVEMLREILAETEGHLAEDHPIVLTSRSDLAQHLYERGQLSDAERDFRRLMKTKQRVFGEDHPSSGQAQGLLAQVLHSLGRSDEAEGLFRESTRIARASFGETHPVTVDATKFLVRFLLDGDEMDEAESLTRELVAALREGAADDDLGVIEGLNLQVQVRFRAKDLAGAEEATRVIIDVLRRHGDQAIVDLARNVSNLGVILRRRGDGTAALEAARESLALQRKISGDRHPETAYELYSLGAALLLTQDAQAAETRLQEALSIQVATLGEKASDTLLTRRELGRALTVLGRHDDAEAELLRAIEGFERLERSRPRRQSVESLVALYVAWNRPEEAAAWRTRIDK